MTYSKNMSLKGKTPIMKLDLNNNQNQREELTHLYQVSEKRREA